MRKIYLLLILAICLGQLDSKNLLPAEKNCPSTTPPESRRQCYPWAGMTQANCEARGCVYCVDNGNPICFFNDNVCPSEIPEDQRVDCFPEPGANKQDCLKRNCMWCTGSTPSVPSCFRDTKVSLGGEFCPNDIRVEERIDCYPLEDTNKDKCISRGCYWCGESPKGTKQDNFPYCFVPKSHGYKQISVTDTTRGLRVTLDRRNTPSWFGDDINRVVIDFEFQENHRLRVKIYDPSKERFEVPLDIPSPDTKAPNPNYRIELVEEPAFGFKVIRTTTNQILFDTTIGGMIISDKFLQIAGKLASNKVYGFGENEHPTFAHDINWKRWGIFARDQPVSPTNLYGVHPFFTSIDGSNMFGVFIRNSHAQGIQLIPAPGIIYHTIGGILDMYFFLGPSPSNVISQFTEAIGRPYFPPYWGLGFQLSRYGFNNLKNMSEAIQRCRQYNIPIDVLYGDIDVFRDNLDFTYDEVRFAGLPEYVRKIRREGMRYIQIQDPCISNGEPAGSYPPYDRGQAANVWVKEFDNVTNAEGKVWPTNNVYFPDYSKASCQEWWIQENIEYRKTIEYDGIWIDMNEPANFAKGSTKGCRNNQVNRPLFKPKIMGDTLYDKTVCMDYETVLGTQYDTHSLYGWSEAEPSLRAMRRATGKRSLVVSRSTYTGAGKYAVHWLGDNKSQWADLARSIIGCLEFNLFGIPYVGADICGFFDDASLELCARWHQLGAFYTFSRNHNAINQEDQDPGRHPALAALAKEVLEIRYTLIPFLYTLFYEANTKGHTVMRSLMEQYIKDSETHNIDKQFMWGSALLINPVLEQGASTVDVYFPDDRWFTWSTGVEVPFRKQRSVISAPLNVIPIYMRGGSIIPTQEPANSTFYSRKNPLGIIVNIGDLDDEVKGTFYWDDGESADSIESEKFIYMDLEFKDNTIIGTIKHSNYSSGGLLFEDVKVNGVQTAPVSLTVNGESHTDFRHNENKVLEIYNLKLSIERSFRIELSFVNRQKALIKENL